MCDGCDGGFHISCVVRELQKEEEECDRLPAPGDGDKEWWLANHVSAAMFFVQNNGHTF